MPSALRAMGGTRLFTKLLDLCFPSVIILQKVI
jgi:hypothetical protein